jgi:hypothetical protein
MVMETEMKAAAAVMMRMMEIGKMVKGAAETVTNWEGGWIMGMNGEGTMFDDDRIGTEVTAEDICL